MPLHRCLQDRICILKKFGNEDIKSVRKFEKTIKALDSSSTVFSATPRTLESEDENKEVSASKFIHKVLELCMDVTKPIQIINDAHLAMTHDTPEPNLQYLHLNEIIELADRGEGLIVYPFKN